ncbi:transposase domain-containing protein [Streptomyces sp. NPDC004647]|uniref:transposase domain-containing protein n=1 Tax=Streptomyces sp. NPDC004647 TaxID=3154671 RepID=UPI00339DEC28
MLTEEISPGPADEVVESTGCGERRRRLSPVRAVVSFILALCLFSSSDSAVRRETSDSPHGAHRDRLR